MKKVEKKHGRRYTEAELAYLESSWGTVSVQKIAGALGRTVGAVLEKAYKMNLGNPLDCTDFLIAVQVKEMLGTDRKTLKRHFQERGLKHKVRTLKNRKLITVQYEDLVEWLIENPQYWKGDKVDRLGLISIGLDEKFLDRKIDEDTKKRARKTLTDKEKEKVIKLYKEYITYKDIAMELNKDFSTIKWFLHTMMAEGKLEKNCDNNRLVRVTKRESCGWQEWQDRLLITEFRNGKTLREISEMVGKSLGATKSRNQMLSKRMMKGLVV